MSPKQNNNTKDNTPTDLAGEYALGLLEGDKLKAAHQRYGDDATFREQVDAWHDRFAPLLDEVKPVAAPAGTFDEISSRLFAENSQNNAEPDLWQSLAFWRTTSLATGLLAAGLTAAIVFAPGLFGFNTNLPSIKPDYVAALNLAKDKPTFLIRINAEKGTLGIRSSNLGDEAEKVPELWVIPEDGKARSLGVLKRDGSTSLSVDTKNIEFIKPGVTLAITLEPPGGAPNGVATGDVIAAGQLQEI